VGVWEKVSVVLATIPCSASAVQEALRAREKAHNTSWGKAAAHEAVCRLESERAREKQHGASWGKVRVKVKVCTP
jgi:hypothetical protein